MFPEAQHLSAGGSKALAVGEEGLGRAFAELELTSGAAPLADNGASNAWNRWSGIVLPLVLAGCATVAGALLYSADPEGKDLSSGTVFAGHRLAQVLTTAEYGIFPAASIVVRKELGMTELELGLVGTLTYAGIVCGSLLAPFLIAKIGSQRCNRLCLLCAACCSCMTMFAPTKEGVLTARFLAGMCHGPLYVYFLVWIDTFAPPSRATAWMGIYAALGAFANLGSYALTAYLVYVLRVSWRWAFSYLSGCLLLLALAGGAVPARLWECEPATLDFRPVLRKPTFWCLVGCVTLQWYALSGVEYFGLSYLHQLGADEAYAAKLYILSGLGIVFGIASCSAVADYFGGYDRRKWALLLSMVMTTLPLPLLHWMLTETNATTTMVLATIFLASFAAVNPIIVGLALRVVPEHRVQASAVLNFVSTGLGFMVGPVAVGVVAEKHGLRTAWAATFCPASCSCLLVLFVFLFERAYGEPPRPVEPAPAAKPAMAPPQDADEAEEPAPEAGKD